MAKRSDHVFSEETKREMANRAGGNAVGTGGDENAASLVVPSHPTLGITLDEAINVVLSEDDGWLRLVPADDGKTLWFKWKFTGGRNRGTYVMVRGDRTETLNYYFHLLAEKVSWARETGLGCVVDHYHDSVFR